MKTNTKKVIILRHGGGRLGNQLWLYANIYAYCLEKNYQCVNYSFYNYFRYFNIPCPSILTKIFELISYFQLNETHANTYPIYISYKWSTSLILLLNKNRGKLLKHHSDELFYLPPTANKNPAFKEKLRQAELAGKPIYFDGQNFANPIGIKKYHRQITTLLKPKDKIMQTVENFLKPYKNFYLVGVHIRQGDYKRFRQGALYFSQKEVAERLRYYLTNIHNGKKKVKFLLFSDETINFSFFGGLNVEKGIGSAIEDLFTLSKCNLIIASKSSFSSFAAYYGNRPLFIFDRDKYLQPQKHS